MALRRTVRTVAFGGALATVVWGVSTAAPRQLPIAAKPGLTAFKDCDDLVTHVRPHAVAVARQYGADAYEESRDPDGDRIRPADPFFRVYGDDAGDQPAPGVESPDAAKFDGDRLLTIGSFAAKPAPVALRVVDVGGPAPVTLGVLALPELSGGGVLVLPGRRALVFGRIDGPGVRSELVLVDAAVAARPRVLRREKVTGGFGSIGLKDGVLRVVFAGRPKALLVPPAPGGSRADSV